MRVCAKWGDTKPESEFSFWSTTTCRECQRAYGRAYYEAHKEEIRARKRKSTEKHRKERPRRVALWRQIQEMTPQERAKEMPFRALIDVHVPPRMLRNAQGRALVGTELMDLVHVEHAVMCPIITHTKRWLKVRRSWMQSKEWLAFRQKYLQEHPVCTRCGAPAKVVHHIGGVNLDCTVINFGFLEILEYPECFEALCVECHYQEHKDLIEAEKEIRS